MGGNSFIQVEAGVKFKDFNLEERVNLQIGRQLSDEFKKQFKNFDQFLNAQLVNVTENLAKSGITETRKKLRDAKSRWGEARMAGVYYGVRFAPEGRSSGREKTGTMYDSLSSRIDAGKDSGGFFVEGVFGWSKSTIARYPYILFQEIGFYSTGRFDPVATAATGRARFKSGPPVFVPGVFSLPKARKEVMKRAASAYSAAWNESVKQYNAGGFSGTPKKPTKAPTGSRRA
jgi:hypothetical protein